MGLTPSSARAASRASRTKFVQAGLLEYAGSVVAPRTQGFV
jgi:hypothetical protein